MKVALFVPPSGKTFAGIERVMVNLAKGFVERRLDVDLVLAEELPDLPPLPPEVRVVTLNAPRLRACILPLVGYLHRATPQVMLSAQIPATCLTVWARMINRVSTQVLSAIHGRPSIEAKQSIRARIVHFLARYFYLRHVNKVIAVSKGAANDFCQTTGCPPDKVRVIYNPVVTLEFHRLADEPLDDSWFRPGEPPVILGVGRLTKQKDFPTLIRAFDLVRRRRPARLMILGEGEDRPKLEALVRELGLEQDVVLPGFVENPYKYMKRAAVFVLSSAWEGFGNVLVEAMAVGTPVVSTDCPSGPAEILEGGKWGKLTPVRDVEALAQAIVDTLSSKPDREKLKARAEAFRLEQIVDQYLEVIEEVSNMGITRSK